MFNLTRYFSTLSFVLIALVAGLLTAYYRNITHEQLLRHEQSRAEDLTQVFENSLWLDFHNLTDATRSETAESLRRRAVETKLRDKLATMMRGTDVIKVKIYTVKGVTAFSTDVAQIGESKADNAGFRSAVGGVAISELTHRNQFDAFEGTLQERDVIATYVPVHTRRDGQESVNGVFEVYQDVTAFVRAADQQLKWVSTSVVVVLASLYLAQFLVVRRAQRILRTQAVALETANLELDRRVQERTRDLEAEVAERRLVDQQLDHLAHHDPLTHLPNRLLFKARLSQSLARIAQQGKRLAVLFIDLDRFKDVNDTLGHSLGDELLVKVSQRLQTCTRPQDTLARLGGDEFVYVLEDMHDPAEATQVAENVLRLFQSSFEVAGNQIYLSASIGISVAPDDGLEVDILVRNADAAMYEAKALGRNRSHFYTAEMTVRSHERVRLEMLLRHAIAKGELAVHFQPKVDAQNGVLCGVEALLRWDSEELGQVPPARFIPLAEENGMIVELGAWVLRQSCQQIAAWDAAGFHVPRMSINLSVKQLGRGDFPQLLREVLTQTGVDPARLEFEITESVIMAVDDAFAMLEALRATGVHLSIDDFGTGYSSLAYLKALPVQTLKIDRAFVMGIGENSGDEAIIRAVIALSHSLGLSTVAEGVETAQQALFLRELGCDQIQGYLYGKPMAEADLYPPGGVAGS